MRAPSSRIAVNLSTRSRLRDSADIDDLAFRETLTVGSVMHRGVVTCRPNDSLRTVAAILAANSIHALVVASPEERAPCAVVTDRDVVYGHLLGKLDELAARDAASEPTVTVRADLDLSEASGLMVRYGTTHVVVTERDDGTPIGILSSLDVAAAVGRQ